MSEPLTFDRFRALAKIYGGSIARWPESVREEASLMLELPAALAALDEAAALDDRLDAWHVDAPGMALRDRIVAAAASMRRPAFRRARLWWSGIGLAATLAGAAAGSVAAATIAPAGHDVQDATAFGEDA